MAAGWSSLVARLAHNQEVVGSNPAPATFSLLWSKQFARKTPAFTEVYRIYMGSSANAGQMLLDAILKPILNPKRLMRESLL